MNGVMNARQVPHFNILNLPREYILFLRLRMTGDQEARPVVAASYLFPIIRTRFLRFTEAIRASGSLLIRSTIAGLSLARFLLSPGC